MEICNSQTTNKITIQGTIHQNYRSVSNLTFLSKVVQKITLNQFTQHCEDYHLLPDYQSAYRKFHSCKTILIKLFNHLFWAMEKQEVTAMTILDLSAAFDTVNHDLLLEDLNKRFGVKRRALKWYEQYLKPRKFKVSINNTYSKEQTINYSVLQGSIQGVFLFNAYASTIPDVIPPNLNSWAMWMTTQLGNHLSQETPPATQNLTPLPSWRIQCLKSGDG